MKCNLERVNGELIVPIESEQANGEVIKLVES